MRRPAAVLASLFLVPLLMAVAPDTFTRAELDALEAERTSAVRQLAALEKEGQATVTDLRTLDNDLLSAAMEARRREEQATKAERSLVDLRVRREVAHAELIESEAALGDLLAALAAANRRRPPALVVSPDNSGLAIRRAILMQATYPKLEDRAAAISAEIAGLNALETNILAEQARLAAAEATLALKKEEIERLTAQKRSAFEGISGNAETLRRRADQLGKDAGTLRDLLTALERNAPDAPGLKPKDRPQLAAVRTTKPKTTTTPKAGEVASPVTKPLGKSSLGGLRQPVAGTLRYGFGDKMPGGAKAEWLVFTTRAEAQVVAPVNGTVEYARAFRSYGQMLILRTSDGYNVILSGMSRIYVSEGQSVNAGEPVGRMPNRDDPAPELSVELRLGDRVMNPAEWMSGGK
ncbi:murein hydrolase activator EnvC family protein [Hyphomonas sp.]|uniref:murein hydrolase activator EnvC family protein n=1 Tax=Hyphomonas sp. TaxID=87 RepID=UPI00391B9147